MDSPEDRDIKLQRASGDLLKELETKLPPLLSKPSLWQDIRVPHRWAQVSKINRIIDLVRKPSLSCQKKRGRSHD
jgi:hypothetical protein